MADPYPGLIEALNLAHSQDGMISTAQALASGLTPGQLAQLARSGRWRRPCRGAYLVPGAHPLRGPARAALADRPGAIICGLTAARIHRFDGLPREASGEPVHLLVDGRGARRQPRGIVLHWDRGRDGARDAVTDRQVGTVDGLRLTSPARTLADLVLTSTRPEGVALMDAALRLGHVPDLAAARELATGRHGSARRRGWWDLADGRAESPLESRLRLLLGDAGLPPPCPQWPHTDRRGRILARLDLAWPRFRLDVEADGREHHDTPRAVFEDRGRQNLLSAAGWTVLRFTWRDVLNAPGDVVRTVALALRAGGWPD